MRLQAGARPDTMPAGRDARHRPEHESSRAWNRLGVLLLPGLALMLSACAAPHREAGPASTEAGAAAEAAPPAGIPPESLGLAPGDLSRSPAPPAYAELEAMPGEGSAPAPAYQGAPPVIPHAVEDFLPITREENSCVMCHMVEEKIEGEPTPIPPSHYIDMRNAPVEAGESIAGARYVCTSCHASRTDAEPLVENRFTSP